MNLVTYSYLTTSIEEYTVGKETIERIQEKQAECMNAQMSVNVQGAPLSLGS